MPDRTYTREHGQCVFETQIATKLREASRTERMKLYGQLYDAYAEAVERWRHYQPWLGELAGLAELQDC
jgi:hypothetical protein